jgi:methionyl-tRNA formyltransferase
MVVSEGMDEGPIVIKKKVEFSPKEILGRIELEKILAREGARLFSHILPEWLQGTIDPIMQNENEATYCRKIRKEDGFLDLNDDPYKNYLKIKALEGWPGTYFFLDNKRVIIKEATFENGQLKIIKVIPEGKKEMLYSDFLRGQK